MYALYEYRLQVDKKSYFSLKKNLEKMEKNAFPFIRFIVGTILVKRTGTTSSFSEGMVLNLDVCELPTSVLQVVLLGFSVGERVLKFKSIIITA